MLSGFSSNVQSEHPVWKGVLTEDPEMGGEPARSAGFKGNKWKWSSRCHCFFMFSIVLIRYNDESSVMSACDTIYLWWVISWAETSLHHSRIYPSCPWPPCNQIHQGWLCTVLRGSVLCALWTTFAVQGGGSRGRWKFITKWRSGCDGGEKSHQRQGTLKQKYCFQLKPWLQRVQVLGLSEGALECHRAGALSGDRG